MALLLRSPEQRRDFQRNSQKGVPGRNKEFSTLHPEVQDQRGEQNTWK